MAKPDHPPRAHRDALRREEDALAAFFDAARANVPPPPSDALMARVLADADALARARPVRTRRARWSLPDLGALLRPFGGWAAAAALAGCLAIGFLAGSLGAGADLAAEAIWPDYVSIEAAPDGVDGFFDLSAAEG